MNKNKLFNGIYNYTVIATYMGMLCGFCAIPTLFAGQVRTAIILLMVAGLFDMFDGKIASTKKNRTPSEKKFGIQIDSLSDIICFGVLPGFITYVISGKSQIALICGGAYMLCALIRLAYFNVLEGNRQQTEGGCNKGYRGLPVTSIAFILPMVFLFQFFMSELAFLSLLHLVLLVVGFLFILDFPLPKPGLKTILSLMGVLAVSVGIILIYTKYRLPPHTDRTSHIVEEVEELFEDIYETETP